MSDKEPLKKKNLWLPWTAEVKGLAAAGFFMCLAWLGFPWITEWLFPAFSYDIEPGTFGDMYGALNTMFSGLAFALLIFTALLQRAELKEQRNELEMTRKVFEKQTAIQDEQLKLLQEESSIRETDRERAIKPLLMLRPSYKAGINLVLKLHNAGPPIFDLWVKLVDEQFVKISITPDTILEKGKPVEITALLREELKQNNEYRFRFGYKRLDDLAAEGTLSFKNLKFT